MLKKTFGLAMLLVGIMLCFSMAVSAEAITVSVTDYGADGSDTLEDNTAIDAAVAAVAANEDKGTVVFPAGTYYGNGIDHLVGLNADHSGITLRFEEGAKLHNGSSDIGLATFIVSNGANITVEGDIVCVNGRPFLLNAVNFKGEGITSEAADMIIQGCDGVEVGDLTASGNIHINGNSRNVTAGNITSNTSMVEIGVNDAASAYYVNLDTDASGVTSSNITVGNISASGSLVFIHNIKGVKTGNVTSALSREQGVRVFNVMDSEIGNIDILSTANENLPGVEIQYVKNIKFGNISIPKTGQTVWNGLYFNAGLREDVTFGDLSANRFDGWAGTNIHIGNIVGHHVGNLVFVFEGESSIGNVSATGTIELTAPSLTVGNLYSEWEKVKIGAKDSLKAGEITAYTNVTIVASNAEIEKVYAKNGNITFTQSAGITSQVTAATGANWRIGTVQSDNCTADISQNGVLLADITDVVIKNMIINNMNAGNYEGLTRALFISGSCGDIAIKNYSLNVTNQTTSIEIGGRGESHTAGANFLIQNAVNHNSWAEGGHGVALQGGPYAPTNVKIYMEYSDPLNPDYDLVYAEPYGWVPVHDFAVTSVTKDGGSYKAILSNRGQTYYDEGSIPVLAVYNGDMLIDLCIGEIGTEVLPFAAAGGVVGNNEIIFTPDFGELPAGATVKVFLWKDVASLAPIAEASERIAL